jgi:hypothetical protein
MAGRRRARITVIGGLCLALVAGFALHTSRGSGAKRRQRAVATRAAALAKKAALRQAMTPAPPVLTPEEAQEARAIAIRQTIETIRAECQRNAQGDWDRWIAQLAPLRDEIREKARAAKPFNPQAEGTFEARAAVLEGKNGFPLFESEPAGYLRHLTEPESLEVFRRGRAVLDGARWLERQRIHVLFVPVPKMTEVYPEFFSTHCPPDKIITPQLRRVMLELLMEDVEVVDLLGTLLRERDAGDEPLYLPADPHWGPRAQSIAARVVADRLLRYDFVARAKALPATCDWNPAPYPPASEGAAFKALNPDQQRRALAVQPRFHLVPWDCTRPVWDDHAPVICIGDSYNGGFMEQLSRELNLPIRNLAGAGQTTQAFKDFLRDPQALEGCKVVVWLVCSTGLDAQHWPMPPAICDAVRAANRG